MIDLYKKYGFDIPLKCRYKRGDDEFCISDEFEDGEELEFCDYCFNTDVLMKGYAFYSNANGKIRMVNISNLGAMT